MEKVHMKILVARLHCKVENGARTIGGERTLSHIFIGGFLRRHLLTFLKGIGI